VYKKSKVLFSLILVTFVIIFMATVPSMAEECGDVDCSGSEPDISDITRLIDYLYLSHDPLCDPMLADVNNSGGEPDISDIVRIIDFLYLSHSPLNCTVYTIPTTTTIIPEVDTTVIKGYETDGTVTLNETSEYAQNVAVGDVIIGQDDVDAPNGFLRKVVSKTSASGTVVLETEPSTMTEAFEMMSINETNVLRPSDVVSYNLYDGVRYLPNKDDETFSVELGVVLYDQDGNTETTDDQIRLDGQYDFTAALFAEIEISWFTLQKFETGIETEDNTNLTLTANLQWSFDEAVEFDLAEFHLGAIPVGGVVWLVPTLTVEAHIHGDLTVTFVTGISYTQQLRYGFGWANDEFYDISEGSKEFTYTEPQLTVEFNFEPGVSLNASCLLYGVAGPYMAAKTGFHFQAALNADPCDVNLTFDLNAILYAVVGIECDILGLDYNKEWQLYTHLIGEWVYPLGGTGTIIIDPEPNSISAPWSLEGPCSYSTSGTGDETLTELDPGDYTITWESVTGWITPSNSTQTLTAGNTLTFSGTYVANNTIPVLTTAAVSDITQTTAECGGNITSDGGATVTARGVCWSTNPTPTVSDSKTTDGSGTSSFTSSITGLSPSTTYYVRAYATNSIGTGYGSVQSFTTLSSTQVPVLTTAAVSDITQTTAQCGGTVTSDGGSPVTARGVCWSTNPTPTVADNKTTDGAGVGSFTSSIIGLTAGTPYYVRAYATNSVGTGYGNEVSFTTSSSPGTVTDIDGNIYQTITIGTQVWMAENLKVTHYSNGDAIPNVTNSETWVGLTTGAYCEYNNDVNNVTTYGRLYNWYAVDDSRSIAPEGWHVPTDEEIKQLEMYLGLSQAEADATGWRGTDEGGKLKETGTTHWVSPNTGATNESGFSALPGGARNYFGHFVSMGYRAFFWSSTEDDDSYYAWVRDLNYDRSGVDRGGGSKQNGFSVRCVRD